MTQLTGGHWESELSTDVQTVTLSGSYEKITKLQIKSVHFKSRFSSGGRYKMWSLTKVWRITWGHSSHFIMCFIFEYETTTCVVHCKDNGPKWCENVYFPMQRFSLSLSLLHVINSLSPVVLCFSSLSAFCKYFWLQSCRIQIYHYYSTINIIIIIIINIRVLTPKE